MFFTPGKKFIIQMDERKFVNPAGFVYDISAGKRINPNPYLWDFYYKLFLGKTIEELNAVTSFIYTEGLSFDPDEGYYTFDYAEFENFWGRKIKEIAVVFRPYRKRYVISFPNGSDMYPYVGSGMKLHFTNEDFECQTFIVRDNEAGRDYPKNTFPPEFFDLSADELDKVCRFLRSSSEEKSSRIKFQYVECCERPSLQFRPVSYLSEAALNDTKATKWSDIAVAASSEE